MMRAIAIAACGAVACTAIACGHAPPPAVLAPGAAITGAGIEQIVEQGTAVYGFGPDRIAIARDGVVTAVVPLALPCGARCPSPVWTSAASIPALDRTGGGAARGRWIVATRYDGTLWRVTATGELEAIGDRFRAGDRVTQIDSAGDTIALGLGSATAVTTDGVHVAIYPIDGELAVARDRLAVATPAHVELWDLAAGTRTTFALAGHVRFLDANGPAPRLVVMQPGAVWVARGRALHRVHVPAGTSAVAAGAELWLREGDALYVMSDGVVRATDARLAAADRLVGAPSGAVWIAAADGARPLALAHTAVAPAWDREVKPVFARVCARCHLPGGSADFDLSTATAWAADRDEIARRVLVTRTMPPDGASLTDGERGDLARWLKRRDP